MKLATRVASGVVLLAIAVVALAVGGVLLDVVVGIVALAGAYEFATLSRALGVKPIWVLLLPLATLLAIRFAWQSSSQIFEIAIAASVMVGLAVGIVRIPGAASWAYSIAGGIYVGLFGYLIALYAWPDSGISHQGIRLVAIAVGGAIVTDTVAYFVGSAIGRHGFFRTVSPSKSWEGAIAGAIACVVAVMLVTPALVRISFIAAAGLGVAITVAGQAGDLAESALKRQAGVKDSGKLIPGHGGLLDRIDSLLFIAPVAYCYLKVIGLT